MNLTEESERTLAKLGEDRDKLSSECKELEENCENLKRKIKYYNRKIDFVELGVYTPSRKYDTSEEFKIERAKIKETISDLSRSTSKLTIAEKGIAKKHPLIIDKSYIEGLLKFGVRAFNTEANLCVESVRWDNVLKMEQQIKNAAEDINKAFRKFISRDLILEELIAARTDDLHLAYDLACKKRIDAELKKQRTAELREQEKVKREFDAAIAKAEKEETSTRVLLEREKQRYSESVSNSEKQRLMERIRELEVRLEMAEMARERVMSMAQQTKKGYVYVISNIGSFGQNVYKIGMSRRVDPTERVDELGDASVPFPFDIHAMIYSENAPELELTLHKHFENKRVNMTTSRKEFFRVTLDEVEKVVKDLGLSVNFVRTPEAQAYWESQAIINRTKH